MGGFNMKRFLILFMFLVFFLQSCNNSETVSSQNNREQASIQSKVAKVANVPSQKEIEQSITNFWIKRYEANTYKDVKIISLTLVQIGTCNESDRYLPVRAKVIGNYLQYWPPNNSWKEFELGNGLDNSEFHTYQIRKNDFGEWIADNKW